MKKSRAGWSAGVVRAAVLAILFGSLILPHTNLPASHAQSTGGFENAIFDVVPDPETAASLPTTPGSTFFLRGLIFNHRSVNPATCGGVPPSSQALGTWRAWGVIADDGRMVMNQSYTLEVFNGSLELQGTTGTTLATGPASPVDPSNPDGPTTGPTEVMTLAGGSGTYRKASGEAQIRPYCSDPSGPFRYDRPFCFLIKESPRRNSPEIPR